MQMPMPMSILERGEMMKTKALLLHPTDNCVVTLADVRKGDVIEYEGGSVVAMSDISLGHKAAIRAIPLGGKILKYGAIIGSATNAIAQGEHIHTQNLVSDYITSYHH